MAGRGLGPPGRLVLCVCACLRGLMAAEAAAEAGVGKGTFVVLAPAAFRPGLPYVAWLSLLGGDGDNVVRLVLRDRHNHSLAQTFRHNVPSGSRQPLRLQPIPLGLAPDAPYSLFVKGETLSGRTLFQAETSVRLEEKTASVFVQTDKGVYKPGAKVHMRVVALGPDLRPLPNNTLTVQVLDPRGNVIMRAGDVVPVKGVWGGSVGLAEEPPLGEWRISVQTSTGLRLTRSFAVEKYVLPKFSVVVRPEAFGTVTEDVVVGVEASYTYGKGVQGRLTLTAEMPWRYYGEGDYAPVAHSMALDGQGKATVRFRNALLRERQLVNDYGYNRIKLSASVTEALTGAVRNASADIVLYKSPVKVKVSVAGETFKPGLPLEALAAVLGQDDSPLPAGAARKALLKVEYVYPYDQDKERTPEFMEKEIELDEDGTKKVTLWPPLGTETLRVEVRYDQAGGNFSDSELSDVRRLSAAQSPSQTFLAITPHQEEGVAGSVMEFSVAGTSAEVGEVAWVVVSRGAVLSGGVLEAGAAEEGTEGGPATALSARLSLQTTAEMAPKSRLLVYAIRSDTAEMVVDAIDFQVQGLFQNKVSVRLSTERAEPGAAVEVEVAADPESYVGLCAVDQSALLLRSANDISADVVEADVAEYDSGRSGGWDGRPWARDARRRRSVWLPSWGLAGQDPAALFQKAGVVVLTDALVYKAPRRPGPPAGAVEDGAVFFRRGGPAPVQAPPAPNAADGGPDAEPQSPVLRSAFPETWLWTDAAAGADGVLRHSAVAPDTLTSWVVSAFAVNERSGLGLPPSTAKLEVFRPFFLRLNLPYSIKQGEHFALQVLVFNYGPETEWVRVELAEVEGLELLEREGGLGSKEKPLKAPNARKVRVAGGGGSAGVFFPIRASLIGELRLRVSGRSSRAGDAVERVLLVEPDGHKVERSQAVLLELAEGSGGLERSVSLAFPPEAVEGSRRASLALVGDLMGPVLATAHSLLRMPYGCGEQNMLNFVPNILVLDYLKATHRLTETAKAKALGYMEAGYQRELNYKRSDGSFSAFGESDDHGSTWLTAFVLKSFVQASAHMFVDSGVVNASVAFLISQQKENGEFAERGLVHHKDMQGGSGAGGVALTAYVGTALLGAGVRSAEALRYVETHWERAAADSAYVAALAAHFLRAAASPKAADAAAALHRRASTGDGTSFWAQAPEEEAEGAAEAGLSWAGARPVDVETAAYGLLVTLAGEDGATAALPVLRWLLAQRNAQGGFSSTQDTVVGLEALAAFAQATYDPALDLTLTLNDGPNSHNLSVNHRNSIVLQQLQLEETEGRVVLKASGKGRAFAQVNWSYYVRETGSAAGFRCEQETSAQGPNDLLLSLCCKPAMPERVAERDGEKDGAGLRYGGGGEEAGRSNMAVLEVEALSGWAVDGEALEGLTSTPGLQRVELMREGGQANVYLEGVSGSGLCVNVSSQRRFPVADLRPASARLYDYYDPRHRVELRYSASRKASLLSACPECWGHAADASAAGALPRDPPTPCPSD